MRSYLQAYQDIWKAGYVLEDSLKKHIDYHLLIDKHLPDTASFFYVVKFPDGLYNFLGRQQEAVSGYSNEEFLARGVSLFLENIHPEEIEIILHQVYPDITSFLVTLAVEERKQVLIQYNYRFRRKNGDYINLLENVHVLELDDQGRPAISLGNVIMLQHQEIFPLRLSIKQFRRGDVAEIVFSKVYSHLRAEQRLTTRELEILQHVAIGKTSKEIGEWLCISPHTVDTHRRTLLKKLGCRSVVELTQAAFQNGLL
jgi:DNA-binding CsgD family transcriptional regulator